LRGGRLSTPGLIADTMGQVSGRNSSEDAMRLVQMGFTPQAAQAALRAAGGNVALAAEQLLAGGGASGPTAYADNFDPMRDQARRAAEARAGQQGSRGRLAAAAPALRPAARPAPDPAAVIEGCVWQLATMPDSVDILITSIGRVLAHPHEAKYKRVPLSNSKFKTHVADAPGGLELLRAVGYEREDNALVLQRHDEALLTMGLSALEAARRSTSYLDAKSEQMLVKALQESKSEWTEAERSRRDAAARRVPNEPPEGAAGNTLLCIHLGDSNDKNRCMWRRFESCNTLEEVVAYVESQTPFQIGTNAELIDVTLATPKPLGRDNYGRTLQVLDLWPSGHIRVRAMSPELMAVG